MGESGSGASTLARALLAPARPGARFAGGRIAVGDVDVLALEGAALRAWRGGRAAMAPQNPPSSLTPHMTVGRQLTELIGVHLGVRGAAARARTLDLMAETDLPDREALFRRYSHELSGGQRQRAVIAAALAARPELIVLDEPTTALDKTVEARVLDLVDRLAARLDATLVYVSHDLNAIARMCDRVLAMRDGAVVEEAAVGALFDRARSADARDLVAALPRLDQSAQRRAQPPVAPPVLRVGGLASACPAPGGWLRRREGPRAVVGIDFEIGRGETLGLVGESGSGKSTVAALIAGALWSHRGAIRLGETALEGPARRRAAGLRRRVQMVFQDPLSSLSPAQTVDEILRRPLQFHFGVNAVEARREARALLDEMEVPAAILSRGPRQLSGGQQQRVAIARALAARPDLPLCDEITSALDVTIQAQVLTLLRRLQAERGLACLFISHDLAVVASTAHRILVLERGEARNYGPSERVLRAPAMPYAARLLAAFARSETDRRPAIA